LSAAEEIVLSRALPKGPESVAAFVELVNPVVSRLCSEASESLEASLGKERSRGDKVVTLLTLLKVRGRAGRPVRTHMA
jgi:hypothetical protein